jgi:hypothetical protein
MSKGFTEGLQLSPDTMWIHYWCFLASVRLVNSTHNQSAELVHFGSRQMLLHRSLGSTAATSRPITVSKTLITHRVSQNSLHKQQKQLQHSPSRHCCPPAAAAADAAPSQQDPSQPAAEPSSQHSNAAEAEQQPVQDVEQQQASSSGVGLPPGLSRSQ